MSYFIVLKLRLEYYYLLDNNGMNLLNLVTSVEVTKTILHSILWLSIVWGFTVFAYNLHCK